MKGRWGRRGWESSKRQRIRETKLFHLKSRIINIKFLSYFETTHKNYTHLRTNYYQLKIYMTKRRRRGGREEDLKNEDKNCSEGCRHDFDPIFMRFTYVID